MGACGQRLEETGENGQGWHEGGVMGKMGHGKAGGVPGENGVPGDRGVPGEDGEVEKAAQLLCSGEVLLCGSAEEGRLRLHTTMTYTLHKVSPQVGMSRNRTYHWLGLGGLAGLLALPEGEKGPLVTVESQVTDGKLQSRILKLQPMSL